MAEVGSLREVEWKRRYETGLDDLVNDFYVPALSRAVQYDRKAGFFSSSALVVAATGLARFLRRGGRMRLLVGVKLSPQDVEAMREGYRRREEVISEALEREWQPTEDEIARDRLAVLAEMIARGLLEIRVVAATDDSGQPLVGEEAEAIFHEKSGIFTDAQGNKVAFTGSINESESAWKKNIERLHVYCSWRDDAPHAEAEVEDFERLWEGKHPRAWTLAFPEALQQRILELRADEVPEYDPLERAAVEQRLIAEEREKWLIQFIRDAPLLENGHLLVEEFAAIKPMPHQREVYRRVCEDYPRLWHMLADEVGLGKTIEAGFVLRYLLLKEIVRRVLILAPAHLIRQWQEELREKFNLWAYHYNGTEYVDPVGERHEPPENPWDAEFPIIIASVQLARRRGRMEVLLAAREWDLIVVDEAHHARRQWGAGTDRRPNRMLRLLEQLRERTRAMLFLTATPMQIDVGELWDLLRLLGMSGRWGADLGDEFRQYFHTLNRGELSREDWAFLAGMVKDFLRELGDERAKLLDERLEEGMRQKPGGAVLWQRLTGTVGYVDGAKLQDYAERRTFEELMREFFRRHTPVRRHMFRYTRGVLREYRRRGLISWTVPERVVTDRFIDLGPARELYDRLEDYISNYYRKAEEKRRGLGYVLTIYRQRLTSSPWAIHQTLSRHQERLTGQLEGEELEEEIALEDPDAFVEVDFDASASADLEAIAEEIAYIDDLLRELEQIGVDPKLQRLIEDLQELLQSHPRAIVFTQYYDTLTFLREGLLQAYGAQVACYSGRGGEAWDPNRGQWRQVTKDEIKSGFRNGRYRILLCTEAASEGLNLQASNVLINYDMPWNPMRVEQRIGRIDRIGQESEQVFIINYYYEGTVEAEIYETLRHRMDLFRTAVGPLQPVLAYVPKAIERVAMTPLREREQVWEDTRAQLERVIRRVEEEGFDIGEFADADLRAQEAQQPPVRVDELEQAFLRSSLISRIVQWRQIEPGVGELFLQQPVPGFPQRVTATFSQRVLEAQPDYVQHCLAWGDPLFEKILDRVPAPSSQHWGPLERIREQDGTVRYVWHTPAGPDPIATLSELSQRLSHVRRAGVEAS